MARPEKGRNRPDETGAYFLNESKISRKYTQIPKDQQDLLSRPEAWKLKGSPNIPAHLFKDAKDAYSRNTKRPTLTTPSKTLPSRAPNGRFSKGVTPTASRYERQPAGESEGTDRRMSWSPSPEAHKLPRQRATVEEMPSTTTPEGHGAASKSVFASVSRFESQPAEAPEDNDEDGHDDDKISLPPSREAHKLRQARASVKELPPMPTATPIYGNQASSPSARRTVAQTAPNTRYKALLVAQNPPSSSISSEPDIEYQPPLAITDVVVNPVTRVRQTAKPAATPPSAQIVPCTWKEKSSPRRPEAMEQPQAKRKRLMKELNFDSSQPATQGPIQVVNETVFTQASNSTADSSITNQVAPAKARYGLRKPVQQRQAKAKPNRKAAPSSSAPPLEQSNTGPSEAVEDDHTVYVSKAPGQRASRKIADQHTSSNSEALPPNGPPSQAPFTAFCVAYPDFAKYDRSGMKPASIGVFVSAVVAIEALQHLRQLPEFLYDDFIRVFCQDYLVYIDDWYSMPRKGQPLTAIQWYNENVPEPIYTKKVMNRQNLQDVRKAYPEKHAAARSILSKNSSYAGPSADRSSQVPFERESPTPSPGRMRQSPLSKPVLSTAHSQPEQSQARSMGPPGQVVVFQDDPRFAARDSSLPSEGRSSPPPEHTPRVVSTVRLQTVSAYVEIMSQPEDDSGNLDHSENTVAVPAEASVKEEELPAPIEQVAPVHDSSQSSSTFETPAFQSQAFNASLGHTESTPGDSQGFPKQPAATPTARFETRIITTTQEQVSSTLTGTQGFETQAPVATSRTIDHSISRIPETAIKPKTNRRATLGTQIPPPSHVPEPGKDGSRLSLGSNRLQYTATLGSTDGGPEIGRRTHKPAPTAGDKHVNAGRRLHSLLGESITNEAGKPNPTTTGPRSPAADKPMDSAQQPAGAKAYTVIKGGPPVSSGRRRTLLASPRASLRAAGHRAPTSSRASISTKTKAQLFEEYCARMKGRQGSVARSSDMGR